jgi:hypothetical protein
LNTERVRGRPAFQPGLDSISGSPRTRRLEHGEALIRQVLPIGG